MDSRVFWPLLLALYSGISVAAVGAYPAKPIRIVVMYAAGGGVDIVTRFSETAVQAVNVKIDRVEEELR